MNPINKNFITAFNLKIHPWTMEETLAYIEANVISHNINMQHMVINAAVIVYAHKNIKLRNAINNSDLINIDGIPVVWALRFLGHKIPERVAGVELFQNLVQLCAEKNYKPYFLGAEQSVLNEMIERFKIKHPKLNIAGSHHGYYTENEEKKIADDIKKSKADMLFIGIASPKKELFLDKYTKYMDVSFSIGVGGAFDVLSGKTKRAPLWMQKIGMEWFFRFLQEPKRMWKRYLITNTLFFKYLIKEKFSVKRSL
ncbi:MAG: WecB/TagA/CpsF family glycosyltransferase [Bacteroidetes bacterium]|nr:WecB/TagA/CpsF family glycosyltransferase [Bacteroidota bacterium]